MPDKKAPVPPSYAPPTSFSPSARLLQERLGPRNLGPFYPPNPNDPDAPQVEIPPWARPATPTSGFDPFEARELEKLYNTVPQLRGRFPSVTSGYGPGYINSIIQSGQSRSLLGYPNQLNLLGMTHTGKNPQFQRGAIEVGEQDDQAGFMDTLAHEFQHATNMLKPRGWFDPVVDDEPDAKLTGYGAGRTFYPGALNKMVPWPEYSEQNLKRNK